ncbi:MAG TPA: hypothetical protein VIL73_10065 [Gaiellaceae bacterium]
MKLRLTGTLVLVLAIAALGSASAYAGNGQGNGNGKDNSVAAPASAAGAQDHGNSANAQGQLKKDEAAAPTASVVAQVDPGAAQPGVKPSNDTAHDTHAAASSDETKLYGNGKTAGQIAVQSGAAPSTILHGPGNSQPHKAAPCSGGHEVDVHALKGKRLKSCGTQPSSPPHSTPDPGKVGDPAHGPNTAGNTSAPTASSPSVPSTSASAKPAVSTKHAGVESGAGVLSATGAIGTGTLPFTGFPIWVVVLIALALIALGLMLRRRSAASSL